MRKRHAGAQATINNAIVISDTHCGCRLGLCPPEPIQLDDGGTYHLSTLQKKLWEMWLEFWEELVPRWIHHEPFDVILNGDAIDGVHHDSTTQISHNLNDQNTIAVSVLLPIAEKARASGGRYYHIRGTEAHVGKSGVNEERLAKELDAVPNEHGQHARWEMWKRVGTGLCHFTHHIGTTSSSAHETSAINAELAAALTDAGRWGKEPPDIIARSHRHRNAEVRLPKQGGYSTAFVTAGWQLKTPFTFRLAQGRASEPQIGGSLIRQGDEELHTRHHALSFDRPKVE